MLLFLRLAVSYRWQDAPFKAAVFGVTLEEVMEAQEETAPDEELPLVLTTLCKKVLYSILPLIC